MGQALGKHCNWMITFDPYNNPQKTGISINPILHRGN